MLLSSRASQLSKSCFQAWLKPTARWPKCPKNSRALCDALSKKLPQIFWWPTAATSSQPTSQKNLTSNSEKRIAPCAWPISKTSWSKSTPGPSSSFPPLVSLLTPESRWKWSSTKWTSRKITGWSLRNSPRIFTATTRWRLASRTFWTSTKEGCSLKKTKRLKIPKKTSKWPP